MRKAVSLLAVVNIQQFERDAILGRIAKTNIDGNRFNRTFNVVLADGVYRRVVISNADPRKFEVQAFVDRSGGGVFQDRDQAFQMGT